MTIAALAVATSCGKSDTPTAASGPVDVRLVVSSGDNTRVGSDKTDNDIRQLRVYAFKGDTKVGYAEADNLQGQNYIPITLSEGGDINFYVIANDNFGPKPTVGTTSVTDWTLLSKTDLESLKFDLSEFGGWSATDDFVSPMSNNRYDEFGNELKNDSGTAAYKNDYGTAVNVTKPTVIPVTVQHALGRLRLMLNKDASAKDVTIKVTSAVLYHRPDAFKLYFSYGEKNQIDDIITFTNNAESLTEPLTEQLIDASNAVTLDVKPDDGYTTIARTYLAPNQYGTYDKTGGKFTTENGNETEAGKDKAYRLELTVEFADTTGTETKKYKKKYKVYLPRVPRNTSIDVQGTFKGTVVKPEFNVMTEAWEEKEMNIPAFE